MGFNLLDRLILHLDFSEGAPDMSTVSKVMDKSRFQNHGSINGIIIIKPYEDMSDDGMEVGKTYLSIFDDGGVAFWTLVAGAEADETTIKVYGLNSYKVTLSTQTLDIYHDYGANQDWSQYDIMVLYIYGCNTGDTIRVEAWNEVYAGKTNGYFYAITDDFTGWKRFIIPLERFTDIAVPTGWENIRCIRLLGGANQSCIYYFDWLIADVGDWRFGEVAEFDGTNDRIQCPDSESYTVTDGDFSASFWMNVPVLPSVYGSHYSIVVKGSFNSDGYEILFRTNNRIYFRSNQAGANQSSYTVANLISVDTWYHIVIVRQSSICKIYVNGVNQTDPNSDTHIDPLSNNRNLYIGCSDAAGGAFFYGLLDEIRIYNKALTEEDIRTLYLMKVK